MMVKSLSRKTGSFTQLLDYLSQEGRGGGFPILHNLNVARPQDLRAVNRAFQGNAKHVPPRKNGVVLYHEILSLSGKDQAHITPETLHDLASKYLSLRAPKAMAYGVIHSDTDHPHLHLVISANHVNSPQKLRLSKAQFASVKHQLEAYEKEKYPELAHSSVLPEPERGPQKKEPIITKKETIKHSLKGKVLTALSASCTLEAFEHRLKEHDIELYRRRGKPTGVISEKRKYRFKTLGLEEAFLKASAHWERIPQREASIRDIVAEKARAMFRGFGFVQEMKEVLNRSERKEKGFARQASVVMNVVRNRRKGRGVKGLER